MDTKTTAVFYKVGHGHLEELSDAEKAVFYRAILDQAHVIVYINQIEQEEDRATARCIWSNDYGNRQIGYTRKEIDELGPRLFEKIIHPEDVQLSWDSIDTLNLNQGDSFCGVYRTVTKSGEIFWVYGGCVVLNMKEGKPWQFLSADIRITDQNDSRKQMDELLRENNRLKYQLTLAMMTKREKEVIVMIAHGKKDSEIAEKLYISIQTAKKHRSNLLKKLNKRNTAELASFATESGLV